MSLLVGGLFSRAKKGVQLISKGHSGSTLLDAAKDAYRRVSARSKDGYVMMDDVEAVRAQLVVEMADIKGKEPEMMQRRADLATVIETLNSLKPHDGLSWSFVEGQQRVDNKVWNAWVALRLACFANTKARDCTTELQTPYMEST